MDKENGSWVEDLLSMNEMSALRLTTDYLLKEINYFVLINAKGGDVVRRLVTNIQKLLLLSIKKAVFICDYSSLSELTEELKFYQQFPGAIFLTFVVPSAVHDQEFWGIWKLLTSSEYTCSDSVVIPICLFGLKNSMIPSCFEKHNTLIAFPRESWKKAEVENFVQQLKIYYREYSLGFISRTLATKTDKQFDIKLTVKACKKDTEKDKKMLINEVRASILSQLKEPRSKIRQCLVHYYQIKNVHVVDMNMDDGVVLQVVNTKAPALKVMSRDYGSGKLQDIFLKDLELSKYSGQYCISVDLDEDKLKAIIDELQREAERAPDGALTGRTYPDNALGRWRVWEVIGRQPADRPSDLYDLFRLLDGARAVVEWKTATDERGFNLLHAIVHAGRPDLLEAVFLCGLWDELRLEVVRSPTDDKRYDGYTPRGLAETLLYDSKGPAVLDEYDQLDELWLAMSPLHRACLARIPAFVRQLVRFGAAVNQRDRSGATCLKYACASGCGEVVDFLLENGADVAVADNKRQTSLTLAARLGRADSVRRLLSKGKFDHSQRDDKGLRAIDYAAAIGDIDVLQAFVDNCVRPDDRLVAIAAKYDHQQLVGRLLDDFGLRSNGRDDDGRTPLLHAVANGNVNELKMLVGKEADLNDSDKRNRNCLHLAALTNQVEMCRYLIDLAMERGHSLGTLVSQHDFYTEKDQLTVVRGCDSERSVWHYLLVNRLSEDRLTERLKSGYVDVVELGQIRASGFGISPPIDVLRREDELAEETQAKRLPDLTPLMVAAWKGHIQVALLLLEVGADPNAKDHFGCTALHFAAAKGDLELVCRLEEKDADLLVCSDEGKNAVDYATENGHQHVVNFFVGKKFFKHGEALVANLLDAENLLAEERVTELRSKGKDIRAYLVSIIRNLQIEMNQGLLDIGSGPVQNESTDNSRLKPADRRDEFAGLRPPIT